MSKKQPLGPKICLFFVSAILVLIMGYVVSVCLCRAKVQPYIDVCELSPKKES